MAQVSVTVTYGKDRKIDLALPDDVPSQFLAEAIAQALDCPQSSHPLWAITVYENNKARRISAANSLADDGVLSGSKLNLLMEEFQPGPRAYLLSHTRVKFFLKEVNLIGRKDLAFGSQVDIDLLPLSAEKVISRQHALITFKNNQYVIEDKSRHGTFVNGQKVSGQVPLRNGDEIGFGAKDRGSVLKFILG